MIKLYDNGVYLLNGTEIVESPEEAKARTGKEVSRDCLLYTSRCV